MSALLPTTLTAWKLFEPPDNLRPLWTPLEGFFADAGYHLFGGVDHFLSPPDEQQIRAPDEFHHRVPTVQPTPSHFFLLESERGPRLATY